jgi:hypothetical protein
LVPGTVKLPHQWEEERTLKRPEFEPLQHFTQTLPVRPPFSGCVAVEQGEKGSFGLKTNESP